MASLQGETGRIRPALNESRACAGAAPRARFAGKPALDSIPLILKKELASVYSNLGKWLQLDGNLAAAEGAYRKALEALPSSSEVEAPGAPAAHESLALCQAMLGDLLRSRRRTDAAELALPAGDLGTGAAGHGLSPGSPVPEATGQVLCRSEHAATGRAIASANRTRHGGKR